MQQKAITTEFSPKIMLQKYRQVLVAITFMLLLYIAVLHVRPPIRKVTNSALKCPVFCKYACMLVCMLADDMH